MERRFARPEAVRKRVHGVIALLFVGFILCFEAVNDSSVIDAIYVVASYTYGPLLGLVCFRYVYPAQTVACGCPVDLCHGTRVLLLVGRLDRFGLRLSFRI